MSPSPSRRRLWTAAPPSPPSPSPSPVILLPSSSFTILPQASLSDSPTSLISGEISPSTGLTFRSDPSRFPWFSVLLHFWNSSCSTSRRHPNSRPPLQVPPWFPLPIQNFPFPPTPDSVALQILRETSNSHIPTARRPPSTFPSSPADSTLLPQLLASVSIPVILNFPINFLPPPHSLPPATLAPPQPAPGSFAALPARGPQPHLQFLFRHPPPLPPSNPFPFRSSPSCAISNSLPQAPAHLRPSLSSPARNSFQFRSKFRPYPVAYATPTIGSPAHPPPTLPAPSPRPSPSSRRRQSFPFLEVPSSSTRDLATFPFPSRQIPVTQSGHRPQNSTLVEREIHRGIQSSVKLV